MPYYQINSNSIKKTDVLMSDSLPHVIDDNQSNPASRIFLWRITDIDSFSHAEEEGGIVVSTTLQSYIHVTVNKRFDDKVRVSYSKMELVDNFEDLEHELVREAMRITGITTGVETTIADIPSRGTGLGSSSSVTVGLLNALHAFCWPYCFSETISRRSMYD